MIRDFVIRRIIWFTMLHHVSWILFVFIVYSTKLTCQSDSSSNYYIAAVVEYAPESNPSLDPAENIYNNVNNYVNFIHNASLVKTDIIVFPEEGLIGSGNQVYYSEIPSVNESIAPCAHNITSLALLELSCAAKSYSMYVVVNIPEIYYNTSTGQTQHFNTDVVFDRNGTIIARYRKYNLFGEKTNNIPNLEHVYFDTDFGVKFGIFICFDIDFKEPALSLVQKYNIRHFVYSLSWISELPFLTAIQTQWAWAYSLDVVLLASGKNNPNRGAAGSGIYQGRQDPKTYTMTDSRGSKLLWSSVSKNNYSLNSKLSTKDDETVALAVEELTSSSKTDKIQSTSTRIRMLQDFVNLFKTELLLPPRNTTEFEEELSEQYNKNETQIVTSLEILTTICQRTLCCDFNINMTTKYEQGVRNSSNRGDDYNKYYYRMAVFDGVRTYSGFATGGVQLCSVIACVDETLESCGLRADDVTAQPIAFKNDVFGNMIQSKIVFDNIQIDAIFADSNAFIFPDILVSGSGDSFGELVSSSQFEYQMLSPFSNTSYCELKSLKSLNNLITFGIYSRQFDRDGQPATPPDTSSSFLSKFNISLLFSCLLIITTLWLRS